MTSLESVFQKKLSEHIKVEHEGFRYQCESCDYNSTSSITLKSHEDGEDIAAVFRNIADEELSHSCDTCNLKFLSRDILQYHMQRVHSVGNYHSDTRPVQSAVKSIVSSRLDCRLCYTQFVKQELLKAHEESVHKFEVEIHMEKHAFKYDGCVGVFDTKTMVPEHK